MTDAVFVGDRATDGVPRSADRPLLDLEALAGLKVELRRGNFLRAGPTRLELSRRNVDLTRLIGLAENAD
ncbi:hypothetical protein [Bradyrhizobium sp. SZCCHNS3052]|uniref:hypothetical protein n=1 Tax=Bradyrhizobium sp. SZCCHNS3052 TaxID=3057321 RepID=UPI002915F1B1|nr:hypothetical protein [Bradyrhizobium sp. SZCCHNS3052]